MQGVGDGIIAVVSDVPLIREAIADHLRRSPAARVVSTSAETLEVLLSALGRERLAVAVVDLHQFESGRITLAPADVIRTLRATYPGVTIVAVGSRIELAAQAMGADVLLETSRASLHELATISASVQGGRRHDPNPAAGELQPDRDRWGAVSQREREVLSLLARGHDNLKIAAELNISERTVKAHVASLFRKLAAENRTELALLGRDAGFRHAL
jgi:DNA-binding NarL/FixJ family response regulator